MGKHEKKLARRIGRHKAQLNQVITEERIAQEEIKREKISIETCHGVKDWGVISPNVVKGLIACCEERISWTEYFLEKTVKKKQELEASKFY